MRKFLILFVFLITGCSTTIPDTTDLKPDEGILVVGLNCSAFMRLDVFETGKGPKPTKKGHFFTDLQAISTRSTFIPCLDKKLKTKVLKEGAYYIGAVAAYGAIQTYSEKDAYKFQIEKQKLNYIGDLLGERTKQSRSGNRVYHFITVDFKDSSAENKKELQNDFPSLFEKYDYKVDIAKQ